MSLIYNVSLDHKGSGVNGLTIAILAAFLHCIRSKTHHNGEKA